MTKSKLFVSGVRFSVDGEHKMVVIETKALPRIGEYVEVFVPDFEGKEAEIKLVKVTKVYHVSHKIADVPYDKEMDAEVFGELEQE